MLFVFGTRWIPKIFAMSSIDSLCLSDFSGFLNVSVPHGIMGGSGGGGGGGGSGGAAGVLLDSSFDWNSDTET